jgi:hypothetical protein
MQVNYEIYWNINDEITGILACYLPGAMCGKLGMMFGNSDKLFYLIDA